MLRVTTRDTRETPLRSARTEAYHNLATLLEAGVPASRAFDAAVEGQRGRFADALRRLGAGVRDGVGLEDSLAALDPSLPKLDRTLVEVGVSSGRLPEVFHLLSTWHGFGDRVRRQVLSGLALPIAVIHVAAIAFPLPRLIAGGGFGSYLWGVFQVLAVWYLVAAILFFLGRIEAVRRIFDPQWIAVPILGKAIIRLELARYCRAFSALHGAGVPASRCAELSAEMCRNRAVSAMVSGGTLAVERGEAISKGFTTGLPREFLAFWTSGEETGDLESMASRLATRLEEQAEFTIAELARWVPRVIYAIVMLQMIGMIFSRFSSTVR